MPRRLPALLLVPLCTAIYAQDNQSLTRPATETLVVTATRTQRDLADVGATISVKTAEDIDREIARDIRDLVRYEPGVSVGGTGDRFGLGGFTIRGLGGNRVLTMIDGVRIADSYSFGPFLSANRDYVDVDGLKALEIMRGPGSALYGSDALAGVVAYRSKDADDYLRGEPFYAGVKLGYSDVDDGSVGSLTIAGGGEALSGMVLYTRRSAHETENQGGRGGTGITRELPDPLDLDSDDTLAKLTWQPADRHRLTLSASDFDSTRDSQVLSDYGLLVGTTRTDTHDAHDTVERSQVGLEYTFSDDAAFFSRVATRIYRQTSEQVQQTRQHRTSLTSGLQTNRWRDSYFDQDVDGLSVQADKHFGGSGIAHYLIVGADYWSTDSASLRNGGTANATTGAPVPEASPLPTRDFPPTSVNQWGIYVQDEISLLAERLLLTPSVRLDSFDAAAHADAVYFAGNPGQPAPADFADSQASPKVSLLYRLTPKLAVYAQYAEGFKAPPYDDVNVGFTNPIAGYKTISNPDLESESSRNTELGLRIAAGATRVSVVAFRNTYDNFIESLLPASKFSSTGGVDPADGLLTFQSQNLDGVEIDGLEVSAEVGFDDLPRWLLRVAAAYAEGNSADDDAPLDSVDPPKAVLGAHYAAPNGRWGGDIVWTLVDAKDADDISSTRLPTDGYGLVDLLWYWQLGERTRLNVGLFNIGDKRYIEWADTAAIAFDSARATYPEAARFTQPGFNAGLNVRVEF